MRDKTPERAPEAEPEINGGEARNGEQDDGQYSDQNPRYGMDLRLGQYLRVAAARNDEERQDNGEWNNRKPKQPLPQAHIASGWFENEVAAYPPVHAFHHCARIGTGSPSAFSAA